MNGYYYQLLSPLVDGECPGSAMIPDPAERQPDAVVLDYAPEPGVHIWDSALGTVRELTAAEIVSAARAKKKAELVADAEAAYTREIPSFAGVVVAAKFVPPSNTQYLSPAELAIFNKINAGYTRLNSLLSQVDAATTIEQINAITW